MYIYDYYIIIYDKLFKYQKHYEEFINKCQNNVLSDKQIVSENNNFIDKQIVSVSA